MKSVSTLTILSVFALASALYAADPAMCGAPSQNTNSLNANPHPAEGKSSIQRSAEECAGQLAPERQSDLLILLNEATQARLLTIEGIASTRAAAIIAARPIGSLADLVGIKGIGLTTLKQILAHDPNANESASADIASGADVQSER